MNTNEYIGNLNAVYTMPTPMHVENAEFFAKQLLNAVTYSFVSIIFVYDCAA